MRFIMLIKNLSPKEWLQIKNLIFQKWPRISESALDKTHGDLYLVLKLIAKTYDQKENSEGFEDLNILNPSYEKLNFMN